MKALKAFIKPFWGITKNCENKNLHVIHLGKKPRNTQVLIKARARDTVPDELIFHPFGNNPFMSSGVCLHVFRVMVCLFNHQLYQNVKPILGFSRGLACLAFRKGLKFGVGLTSGGGAKQIMLLLTWYQVIDCTLLKLAFHRAKLFMLLHFTSNIKQM